MGVVDLAGTAAGLPEAWSSRRLGMVGAACVKVLRMDDLPVEEESHGAAEALLVLDGRLELEVDGMPVSVRAGELFMVEAGTAHAVRPGSRGTLVIVELPEE
ncbi:cupin domain-containing protein [Streptomyces sp. NPDC048560]|uniref:cupin domain-containing protein n=1 Tax=Streptomyces sp. NPDC048560 TaxID=3155488 RepID=UPI003443A4C6